MIDVQAKLTRDSFILDVSLQLNHHVTALCGASGSGKSTLLNIIAGIIKPDSGYISIAGKCVFDSKNRINKAMHQRRIGLVFQDGRLFPHMTVEQNLNYAIGLNNRQNQLITKSKLVELLEIESLIQRRPHQLSGGEKQRVALGRTLLGAPNFLLLDEPLASLDEKLKQQILPYLKLITQNIDIPMLYVSHNRDEITQLTSHIVHIDAGKLVDTPKPL